MLLLTDLAEQAAHGGGREQAEGVVVGARADGGEHLVRLGGGEDEDQVGGRLFHDLEQRVEARGGDHMRLVDDEDAVAGFGGRVEGAVAEFAGVVDATVARGVEFDDIEIAGAAGTQRHTGRAHPARGGGRPLRTVE